MAKAGSQHHKMAAERKKQQKATEKSFNKDMKLFGGLTKGIFELTFAPLAIFAPKKKKRRSTRRRKRR